MVDVTYPVAFLAGVVSFFAPCMVPLLPAYMGYVLGVSAGELKDKGYSAAYLKKLIISSIFYIVGFSLIFVLLGTTAASIGILFRRWDFVIRRLGGLVILIFGLEFAGILNIPILARQKSLKLASWMNRLGYLRAFFVGVVFAAAWTPCVGAVLGSILTLAAVADTAIEGARLLMLYSLGISLPFLFVSVTLASAPKYLPVINRHAHVVARVGGLILAAIGLMLLTDTYKYLNALMFNLAFAFGYKIE